jgi:hypothetical protein
VQERLVADVVAQLGLEAVLAVDRAQQLTALVDLQEGLQRVVVEDHRQPLLTRPEQHVAQVLVGAQPPPQLDGERRIGADADGEVARSVAGAHLDEPRLQVVAQRLGHASPPVSTLIR